MKLRTAVTFALVAACAYGLRAQQAQSPTFRTQVDLIELDAIVTDAQGNVVTDLTADDFEVLEDGRPQTIAAISLVNIPVGKIERPLFAAAPVEPDVFGNQGGEGRIYVLALDEVHPEQALRTRAFLRNFIEQRFAANDIAAVVWIGRGSARDTQDFTSNRRLLLNAIERFQGGFITEPPPPPGPGGAPPQTLPRESFDVRSRMKSLRTLSEFMAALKGRRKAMLYVSTGLGFDMFNVTDYNGGVMSLAMEDAHAAMTAATRGNVTIYAIDPRGLSPDGALGDREQAFTADERGALRDSRRDLRTFAELTGGFAFTDQNDFNAAFERIVRENSTYYVLGFYSTNERRDGRYRRLQVRVKRPGLQVRARNGYVAPTGRAPATQAPAPASGLAPSVAEALSTPLANPGIPMKVFAAPYRGPDDEAAVTLVAEFDADMLDFAEKDGTFRSEVDLATIAVNEAGRRFPGNRHQIALALKPDTYDRVLRDGLRIVTETRLPPGRYQLRVAVGTSAGKAGSVVADLEVPDFSKASLVLSGVSLTSTSAAQLLTRGQNASVELALPGPVTAGREFASGETVALFAEVYENLRRAAAHTVDVKAELRADDGRVLRTVEDQRSSTELSGRGGGYGFTAQIPLTDVLPGLYVIHVEARANIGDRLVVGRDVLIRVR